MNLTRKILEGINELELKPARGFKPKAPDGPTYADLADALNMGPAAETAEWAYEATPASSGDEWSPAELFAGKPLPPNTWRAEFWRIGDKLHQTPVVQAWAEGEDGGNSPGPDSAVIKLRVVQDTGEGIKPEWVENWEAGSGVDWKSWLLKFVTPPKDSPKPGQLGYGYFPPFLAFITEPGWTPNEEGTQISNPVGGSSFTSAKAAKAAAQAAASKTPGAGWYVMDDDGDIVDDMPPDEED